MTEARSSAASLAARLHAVRPLLFDGADEARHLPGHVRAGSAIRRWGQRLADMDDPGSPALMGGLRVTGPLEAG